MPPHVFADTNNGCAENMSELDCAAIYNDWVYWLPLTGTVCSDGKTVLTGNDNIQKGFNFFGNAGLSQNQAAAVIGNLLQESGMNPTIIQGGRNSKNPNDAGSLGWGLAQWTPGSKIIGIAKDLGITSPIYSLETQLNIILGQMRGTSPVGAQNVYGKIRGIPNLEEAVRFFEENFEGAGDPQIDNRIEYARQVLEKYGDSTGQVSGSEAGCNSVGAVDCSNPSTETEGLSVVRQNAVCVALAENAKWESGSKGPGGDFFEYTQGRDEEWCADFVSWVFNKAGYPLSSTAKDGNVPAVDTIAGGPSHTNMLPTLEYHSAGGYTPVPGDIAIYQSGQSHVNLVTSVNKNEKNMTVVGGNQGGISVNSQSKVTSYTRSYEAGDGLTGFASPKG